MATLATALTGTGLLRSPVRAVDGWISVPEGPGLGIEPNVEFLRDLAGRPQPRTERTGALYR